MVVVRNVDYEFIIFPWDLVNMIARRVSAFATLCQLLAASELLIHRVPSPLERRI